MTISVLGPLQVTVTGRLVALPAKQRTLLAVLAFQANRVVPQHRLIQAGWGEDASPGLARTLQSHIFQLRRALSLADEGADGEPLIVTEAGGYRLQADAAAIDAKLFVRLLEAARAEGTDNRTTVALLQRALGLWRGPGAADVGDEVAALAEIQQLEWLRLTAIEDLARLRLALGEHEQLIPELRRSLVEAPYNEQLWASLMIALERCGKRAEALIAYQHARAALRAELDIDPGAELQALALRMRDGTPVDLPEPARPRTRTPRVVAPAPAEATIRAC